MKRTVFGMQSTLQASPSINQGKFQRSLAFLRSLFSVGVFAFLVCGCVFFRLFFLFVFKGLGV